MASRIASQAHVLPPEDHELLHRAIEQWHDLTQFSDEQVNRVKDVFRRVFGLSDDCLLVGSALPDAIVLQPPSGNMRSYYAIVQIEDGAWEAMELDSDASLSFTKTLPFRVVLALLATSNGGLIQVSKRWQETL